MNAWKEAWDIYTFQSTSEKVLYEKIKMIGRTETIKIALTLLLFVSIAGLIIATPDIRLSLSTVYILLAVLLLIEYWLILKLEEIKSCYIDKQLGGDDISKMPPENTHQRQARYLKFRKELIDKGIKKTHLKEINEALCAKEELEEASNIYFKKYLNFIWGAGAGIIVTLAKSNSMSNLIGVFVTLILFSFIVPFLLALIPSKTEKLKEMKYFLVLYGHENAG